MRKLLTFWPFLIPILALTFGLYMAGNAFNPDSYFCLYQIYKYSDGSYEVWFNGRTKHSVCRSDSYSAARDYQVGECRKIREFLNQSPKGERVTKTLDQP